MLARDTTSLLRLTNEYNAIAVPANSPIKTSAHFIAAPGMNDAARKTWPDHFARPHATTEWTETLKTQGWEDAYLRAPPSTTSSRARKRTGRARSRKSAS